MKQVAIAIVLSVLLYCYSLIMGTSDAVLPWALKILMIALVTVAVFIYRKPFHPPVLRGRLRHPRLAASGPSTACARRAPPSAGRRLTPPPWPSPGVAGYRAARWARRNPGQAAGVAAGVASGAGAAAGRGGRGRAADGAGTVPSARATRTRRGCGRMPRPRPTATAGRVAPAGWSTVPAERARRGPGTCRRPTAAPARMAPPLDLPPRSGGSGGPGGSSGSGGSADRRRRRVGFRLVARRRAARRQAALRARAAAPQPRDPRHLGAPVRSASNGPRRRSPAAAPGREAQAGGRPA